MIAPIAVYHVEDKGKVNDPLPLLPRYVGVASTFQLPTHNARMIRDDGGCQTFFALVAQSARWHERKACNVFLLSGQRHMLP